MDEKNPASGLFDFDDMNPDGKTTQKEKELSKLHGTQSIEFRKLFYETDMVSDNDQKESKYMP